MRNLLRIAGAAGVAAVLTLTVAACDTASVPTAPVTGAAVSGAGASSEATGGQDVETVCHVTSEGPVTPFVGGDQVLGLTGHVITVAQSAVAAHCGHGDHKPQPQKVTGDPCQRRIDIVTQNTCDGGLAVFPRWSSKYGS